MRHLPSESAICESAASLFATHSFATVTMDDIAASCGITKRTLYRYVASKTNLLFKIHDRFFRAVLDRCGSSLAAPNPLLQLVKLELLAYENDVPSRRTVFETLAYLSLNDKARIQDLVDECHQLISRAIVFTLDNRVWDSEKLALSAKFVLGGVLNLYRWYQPRGRYDPDRVAEIITQFFEFGLGIPATVQDNTDIPAITNVGATRQEEEEAISSVQSKILEAAARLFGAKGFHGTTTREIAAAIGITPGALYYYATTKDELLYKIQEKPTNIGLSYWEKIALCSDISPAVAVACMIKTYCDVAIEYRDEVIVFSTEMRFLPQEPLNDIVQKRHRYTDLMASKVDELRTTDRNLESQWDQSVPSKMLAVLILSIMNSTYRWLHDETISRVDFVNACQTLVLSGIRGVYTSKAR
jgi:AcrR family transcriptional regulator